MSGPSGNGDGVAALAALATDGDGREYAGRSLLDALPPAPASAPTDRRRALLLGIAGRDGEVVVLHDGDPLDPPTERRFGATFLAFSDGQRVRADAVAHFAEVSLADALARLRDAAAPPEPVPVAVVREEPTAEEDLGIDGWSDEQVADAVRSLEEVKERTAEQSLQMVRLRGALLARQETRKRAGGAT